MSPHRNHPSLREARLQKLGPFRILERVNPIAFRLELSPTFRLHNVFHACLLKLYHPSRIRGRQPHPSLPVELSTGEEYEVDRILDSRLRRRRIQYLVLWKGTLFQMPHGN